MNSFEQALVSCLGEENLRKVQAVSVGIAGAGGLGSNCANYLVRSGFKKLHLVDFDRVEASNLTRQFYFRDQIGEEKVVALKANLLKINPDLEITTSVTKLDTASVLPQFSTFTVVVEAFDGAEDKAMLVSTLVPAGKYVVTATGLAGYGNTDRIRTEQLGVNLTVVGDRETGVGPEAPPLAPRVNVAAAKQADAVLEYVLKNDL